MPDTGRFYPDPDPIVAPPRFAPFVPLAIRRRPDPAFEAVAPDPPEPAQRPTRGVVPALWPPPAFVFPARTVPFDARWQPDPEPEQTQERGIVAAKWPPPFFVFPARTVPFDARWQPDPEPTQGFHLGAVAGANPPAAPFFWLKPFARIQWEALVTDETEIAPTLPRGKAAGVLPVVYDPAVVLMTHHGRGGGRGLGGRRRGGFGVTSHRRIGGVT